MVKTVQELRDAYFNTPLISRKEDLAQIVGKEMFADVEA
jgi:hypothetical protein